MIISASRRTDIPAFYAEWMINRFRAGYCLVPNPMNRRQVSRISLVCSDVDVVVFWTRNPKPLMPYLAEIEAHGIPFYFLYSILGYPCTIDPHCPPLHEAIRTFRQLADCVGPSRVIWRYDPIVLSTITTPDYHANRFSEISQALEGYTKRAIISIVDQYRKSKSRMAALKMLGVRFPDYETEQLGQLMRQVACAGAARGIHVASCAEECDFAPTGISRGKCIDDVLIAEEFGIGVSRQKDRSQREACHCIVSRDIGMYDSCLHGCVYCYATKSLAHAKENFQKHSPHSPSLFGSYALHEE